VNPSGISNPESGTASCLVALRVAESETRFHLSFSYVFAAHQEPVRDGGNRFSMDMLTEPTRQIVIPPDNRKRRLAHCPDRALMPATDAT
jgi:hypothetical protein